MKQADDNDEGAGTLGIITELANLPPGTILTLHGMAQIFGKSANTIMRAVGEGRLPKPFRIFSENCWRAGDVDGFLQRRMQDAQDAAVEHWPDDAEDTPLGPMRPLRRGASPIRSESHARNN